MTLSQSFENLCKLVFSERLFVSSEPRGVGRFTGRGWQQWGGWATPRWGGGGVNCGGVSFVRVSSTSKNRPSHHKYKFPEQFELKQS